MYITKIIEAFSLEELSEKIEKEANDMLNKGYELVTMSTRAEDNFFTIYAILIFKK